METAAKKAGSLVRWLAVLCLAVLLGGAARAQTGSITGQVMAADTREPLAGAAVEVSGPALAGKKGAIADEKGRYAIEKVPEGVYVVKVTYVGYVAGVAGIVSVTSKDPRTSQGTTVAISTGSRSLLTGRVRHAGLRGKWGWKVAADYQQARDFEKINTFYNADSTLSATDDPDFDTDNTRGSIGLFYYPGTRSSMSLKVGASRSDLIDMLDSGRMHRKGLKEVYQQFTYTSPHFFANLHRRVETVEQLLAREWVFWEGDHPGPGGESVVSSPERHFSVRWDAVATFYSVGWSGLW